MLQVLQTKAHLFIGGLFMILSPLVLTSCKPENAEIPQKKVRAVELNITITPFIEFQKDIRHRERIMQYLLEHHFKKSGITAVCDKADILLRYSTRTPTKDIMLFLAYTSLFESLAQKMEKDNVSFPEDKEIPATPILPLSADLIEYVMSAYSKQSAAQNAEELTHQFPLINKGKISQYADDKTTYFSSLSVDLKVYKKDKLVTVDFNFLPEGYFSDYGINFHKATASIVDTMYIDDLKQDMNTDEKRAYYLNAVYESSQIQTIRKKIAVKNARNINYLTDPIVVPTSPTDTTTPDIPIAPDASTDPVTPAAPATPAERPASHTSLSAPF